MKLATTIVAALLAGSVGVAFAQSDTSKSMKSGTTQSGKMAKTSKDKLTGCKTMTSKEEKGRQGAIAQGSSHNAATTGSNVMGKPQTGC